VLARSNTKFRRCLIEMFRVLRWILPVLSIPPSSAQLDDLGILGKGSDIRLLVVISMTSVLDFMLSNPSHISPQFLEGPFV